MAHPLFLGFLQGTELPPEEQQRLSLPRKDRETGLHVVGAPGRGKSRFLEHLIRQAISNREGLCLIDPHGELYHRVLEWCAHLNLTDREIIPLNFSTGEHIIGFNPFIDRDGAIAAQVDRRITATAKAWGVKNTDETPHLEKWLRCIYHPIVAHPDLTLCEADLFILYGTQPLREPIVAQYTSPLLRGYWDDLHQAMNDAKATNRIRQFTDTLGSAQNRLTRFLESPLKRFFGVSDPARNIDARQLMDRGAVLLVNLQESRHLTESNQRLIGALLVNEFVNAALGRDADAVARGELPPFHLFLDEFQYFVSRDIGRAVTQTRKFGLTFTLAHQTLAQIRDEDPAILDAILGAVGARAVFGNLGYNDAMEMAKEIFPGKINYTELKFLRQSIKFWPVYDRERVITEGVAESEAYSEASGSSTARGSATSSGRSTGLSTPIPYFGAPFAGGTALDSSGWGSLTSAIEGDSFMHGASHATTRSKAVADVPIYRPVPFLEGQPEHFTLEEQWQRLSDALRLQLARHCFFKPPADAAVPLLVPMVKRFYPDPETVAEYEAERAKAAGALTPAEVDAILADRRGRIEQAAREFAANHKEPVHSKDDEQRRPTTTGTGRKLKPRPKAAPKGTDRPEE